jgi:carbamoyl-phosphate synthase large subunit
MPKDLSIKSVLIIGSGPMLLVKHANLIMQDHNQHVPYVKGIEVILINSNPATIMTDPSMADHIYLKPLTNR